MTEKEIHDQVTELFDAIKSNNDPKQREIGALMVTRFLFNMERIADGLSRLSETVINNGQDTMPAVQTRDWNA